MFKSRVSLSEKEVSELQELCHLKKYKLRSRIILFHNLDFRPREIAVQLHCHIQTVYKAIRLWNEDKFSRLLRKKPVQEPSGIIYWKTNVIETVQTPPRELKQGFATWSVKRLWYYLRQKGCHFGRETVRRIMKEAHYKYRRTRVRPYAVSSDYAERKAKVLQNYLDTDEDHLVLVLDQKIFLTNVGVKGGQWGREVATIPSHQWHKGKAFMLGVYDVKANKIYHAWAKDLKAESIRNAFTSIYRELPKAKKTTIIMDNYQGNRAKIFQKSLKRKGIKVCWLPAWSPHLSLIENKFSLVKAEAIVGVIISSVRALKMHVTRWVNYYNSDRKLLYPAPKYSLG